MPVSHAMMRRLGFVRMDRRPWEKTAARWENGSGWSIEHCGHPTALNPWQLFAPDGRPIAAPNGRHWTNLLAPATLVASQLSKSLTAGELRALKAINQALNYGTGPGVVGIYVEAGRAIPIAALTSLQDRGYAERKKGTALFKLSHLGVEETIRRGLP